MILKKKPTKNKNWDIFSLFETTRFGKNGLKE